MGLSRLSQDRGRQTTLTSEVLTHCLHHRESCHLSSAFTQGSHFGAMFFLDKTGAGEEIRTLDPNLGKVFQRLLWTTTGFAALRKTTLKQSLTLTAARRIYAQPLSDLLRTDWNLLRTGVCWRRSNQNTRR